MQGATSPDPSFGVFVPTPGKTITLGGQMFTGSFPFIGGSGTVFTTVRGILGGSSDAEVQSLMPRDCEASGLRMRVAAPLAVGEQIVVTLRVNGAVDALTCTANSVSSLCNSGATTASIVTGNLVAIRLEFMLLAAHRAYFGFLCH